MFSCFILITTEFEYDKDIIKCIHISTGDDYMWKKVVNKFTISLMDSPSEQSLIFHTKMTAHPNKSFWAVAA